MKANELRLNNGPLFGRWWLERLFGFVMVFSIYALYFPLTSYTLQLEPLEITTGFDRVIPLTPFWVVIYAMIYPVASLPLFAVRDPLVFRRVVVAFIGLELIAMSIFLMCPVHMTIRPPIEMIRGDDFFSWGTKLCYYIDHPTCCFPSLHVATATLSALSCFRVNPKLGRVVLIVAGLISASTLLIKQHFVWDVVLGGSLAYGAYVLCVRKARPLDPDALAANWPWLLIPTGVFGTAMALCVVLYLNGFEPWR